MIDLNKAIRAAVNPGEVEELEPFIHALQRAVTAALDCHPHMSAAGAAQPLPDPFPEIDDYSVSRRSHDFGCTTCHYVGYGSVSGYGWCLTVRGIARELGIEMER